MTLMNADVWCWCWSLEVVEGGLGWIQDQMSVSWEASSRAAGACLVSLDFARPAGHRCWLELPVRCLLPTTHLRHVGRSFPMLWPGLTLAGALADKPEEATIGAISSRGKERSRYRQPHTAGIVLWGRVWPALAALAPLTPL